MVSRRTVMVGLGLLTVPGLAQAQQVNRRAMEELFEGLSVERRKRIQSKLTAAGVYDLGIDAIYGPGTEGGLLRGAQFLNRKAGKVVVNLSTRKGVADYYRGVLDGSFDKYIY
jgi:hypothetical protein